MTRLSKSSVKAKVSTTNLTDSDNNISINNQTNNQSNNQASLSKIRNIIVMQDVNSAVDDEADISDSDIFILLSRRSRTDDSLEIEKEDDDFDFSSEDLSVTEKELILGEISNAINFLSRRPVAPVKEKTKTSESGATRKRKTHNLAAVSLVNEEEINTTQISDNDYKDDEIDLLTSTFANILTLMSRRPVAPVKGRTKTSESGAVRTKKTRSLTAMTMQSEVEQISDNNVNNIDINLDIDNEDEDLQLLTSTFTNILTLMSRRPVAPVKGRTKTSESGAVRTKKTRSVVTFDSSSTSEEVIEEEVIKSSFTNILTLMSRRPRPPVNSRTKTSESGAVRIYRIR